MKAVGILTISRKKMLTVKILTTKSCLEELTQCRKVAVLAVVTDCRECNKQALLEIEKMLKTTQCRRNFFSWHHFLTLFTSVKVSNAVGRTGS